MKTKSQQKIFQELKEALNVDPFDDKVESQEASTKIYVVSGIYSYEGQKILKAFNSKSRAEEFQTETKKTDVKPEGLYFDFIHIEEIELV